MALGACAHSPPDTLAGRVWDARAERYIAPEELFQRAAQTRHVLLGETHDNAEHHRLQLRMLEALAASVRGEVPQEGPRGGKKWSGRYFVRREAWHVLDHTWEIEDRAEPG